MLARVGFLKKIERKGWYRHAISRGRHVRALAPKEIGYYKGAAYLENLSRRIFTNIELWLRTGVIAPKTTSLLERIFREIGRRVKRIVWGWTDATVTKLSKIIILKKYSKEKWQRYWKNKLGIEGNLASSWFMQKYAHATTFERYQIFTVIELNLVRKRWLCEAGQKFFY